MKKDTQTFLFLAIWCALILIYFTVWKNSWFILISTNTLLLTKIFLDFRENRRGK